jgi:hypothetical protein
MLRAEWTDREARVDYWQALSIINGLHQQADWIFTPYERMACGERL